MARKRILFSGGSFDSGTTTYTATISGGLVLSGEASASTGLLYPYEASGGVSASGVATTSYSAKYEFVASGGISLDGTSANNVAKVYVASDGIKISGTADTLFSTTYVYAASGVINIDGSAVTSIGYGVSYISSGGVLVSGDSSSSKTRVYLVTIESEPYDVNFDDVSLLLHFNDTDESTSFVDSSTNALTITSLGVIEHDTAEKKFGSSSGLFVDTSYPDRPGLSVGTSSVFGFGTGDFTVEGWFYMDAAFADRPLVYFGNTETVFYIAITENLEEHRLDVNYFSSTGVISTGEWHFFAVVRESGVLSAYVDATRQFSESDSTNFGASQPIFIGTDQLGYSAFQGWLDEIRITKGVARYSGATITVPTQEFPETSTPPSGSLSHLKLSGDANTSGPRILTFVVSGGLYTSGTATTEGPRQFIFVPTGGLYASGIASTDGPIVYIYETSGEGGLIFSGPSGILIEPASVWEGFVEPIPGSPEFPTYMYLDVPDIGGVYQINSRLFTLHTKVYYASTVTQDNHILFLLCDTVYYTGPTKLFAVFIRDDEVTYTRRISVEYTDGTNSFLAIGSIQLTEDRTEDIRVIVDTAAATASSRLKLYVNNSLSGWESGSTFPTQNFELVGTGRIETPRWHIGGTSAPLSPFVFYSPVVTLRETYYLDGIHLTHNDIVVYGTPLIYGNSGWSLEYRNALDLGEDSGPNALNFTTVVKDRGGIQLYSWEGTTHSRTISLGTSIESAAIVADLTIGFELYSGVTSTLVLPFTLLVDASSYTLSLTLFGSGVVASLTLGFQLFNLASYSTLESATWGCYLLVDGVDVSSKLIGEVSIELEEDSSTIAQFTLVPSSGTIELLDYIGKEVEIHYQYLVSNVVVFRKRKFYGMVSDISWDADRRLISFIVDTQMPAYFNSLTKEEISSIIGGLWSDLVWDNDDDATGWSYAQERLFTTENCIWHDENWTLRVDDIKAKRIGEVLTPDVTFTDSERFHETLRLEYAQRSEMTNEIRIDLNYAYQRKRQRTHKFNWTTYGGVGTLACGDAYQMCQRSMIESAATGGSWVPITKIKFEDVWKPQMVTCGAGIGNQVAWGFHVEDVYVPDVNNANTTTINANTGTLKNKKLIQVEGVVDSAIAADLCIGASWTAARRWLQDVNEKYDISVRCQDSINEIGVVASTESYTIDSNSSNEDWENSLEPYKDPEIGSWLTVPGSGDKYVNGDEDTDWTHEEHVFAVLGNGVSLSYKDINSVRVTNLQGNIVYQFQSSRDHIDSKNGWYDSASGTLYVFLESIQTSRGAVKLIAQNQELVISYDYANGLIVNRSKFNDAQTVIISAARADIIRAHRLTTVSFKVAYQPTLDLSKTVKVDTPYLVAAGKVKRLIHILDLGTGEASTEVFLAISRHTGTGLYVEDPVTTIERPLPATETAPIRNSQLNNYIGGRLATVGFTGKWVDGRSDGVWNENTGDWDEEPWEGFLTNFESPLDRAGWAFYWSQPTYMVSVAHNYMLDVADYKIPYQFIVRGPDIEEEYTETDVAADSTSYNILVPNDLLVITV